MASIALCGGRNMRAGLAQCSDAVASRTDSGHWRACRRVVKPRRRPRSHGGMATVALRRCHDVRRWFSGRR